MQPIDHLLIRTQRAVQRQIAHKALMGDTEARSILSGSSLPQIEQPKKKRTRANKEAKSGKK